MKISGGFTFFQAISDYAPKKIAHVGGMLRLFTAQPLHAGWAAVARVVLGLLLCNHGLAMFDPQGMEGMAGYLGKMGFPAPLLFAYLAKGSEFFGGLLLAIGLGTRLASLFLAITMGVALFHAHHGDLLGEGELAGVYLLIAIHYLLAGAGPWSVDALIHRQR